MDPALTRNGLENRGNTARLGALIAAFLGLAAAAHTVVAAAPEAKAAAQTVAKLSDADNTCLACHSFEGMEKKFASGEKLSLQVLGASFAQSVHASAGCAGCHADVDVAKHPGPAKKFKTAREHSLAFTGVCRNCHEDKFKLYEGSVHEKLLKSGVDAAPVCTDCHNPHSVKARAALASISGVSCRKCHEPIFDAYAASMHGTARGKLGHSAAPICADCHRAHDIGFAGASDRLKAACLGCHQGVADVHARWLPNAARHLDVIACAACHSPAAERKVDLRLVESGTQARVAEGDGNAELENRLAAADKDGKGIDAIELWNVLREINRDRGEGRTTLRGRLEVRTGVQAHQLADKSQALRTCETCHRQGADPFQNVSVSIIGVDGRPLRQEVQKEVLTSVLSVDSMGGFYAVGGTRIKLLDLLLVLSVLGGLAVPVGHQMLRWMVRRHLRLQAEAARAAAGAAAGGEASGGPSGPGASRAPGK
ncbi:MAG: hypothetical protein IT514_05515 [Burkholderiales bacterium]|nr:hypothetical protein [Burkholderiales bacterium]